MPLYMICNGTCINEYGVVAIMAKNLWHSILPRILPYILPRILPYILPYILNDSVRIRWEFVESLDMFGWLLRISHRWAGLFDFHVSWSVYGCMVYQRNLAKILWQNLLPQWPNEIPTKQNRQKPVIQGIIANCQISWQSFIAIYRYTR